MTLLVKEVKNVMDEWNSKILNELTEDGRVTMHEHGEMFHLTAPTTAVKAEKLERQR